MEYIQNWAAANPIEVSAALLIVAYVFIATEVVSKSVVALVGACITLLLGLVSQSKTLESGESHPALLCKLHSFTVFFFWFR